MIKYIRSLLLRLPTLYLFLHIFRPRLPAVKGGLKNIHNNFKILDSQSTLAVDLGCGFSPSNYFDADKCIGVDLIEDKKQNILKCNLGFEKLPFESNSVNYITAYDLLEHIPKFALAPECNNAPFIFLMNECYRVLKKDGIFFSHTPVYPYLGAFVDPTHNNIMTSETFKDYFSDQQIEIAKHYGIKTNFKIRYQGMSGMHLVAVLEK